MSEKKKSTLLYQEFQMTFSQDADCCDGGDQFLTIKTQNGGGGDFYVIETERWAFDNISDIINAFLLLAHRLFVLFKAY